MKANLSSIGDVDWCAWTPIDTVSLTFIIKDDQVLLINQLRGFGKGKINAPGGRVEPGETLLECAIRELQEELCIKPVDPEYGGRNRFQFTDGYCMDLYVHVAFDFSGTPTESSEAIPNWFPLNSIPYEKMWADEQLWLPFVLKGKVVDGRYLYNGERVVEYQVDYQ